MTPISEEEFYERFCASSVILSDDGIKDRTRRPSFNSKAVFGIDGLRRLAADYVRPVDGILASLREGVREAISTWANLAKSLDMSKEKAAHPDAVHQEKINRKKAQLRCAEAESRKVHGLIKQHDDAEKAKVERLSQAERNRQSLIGRKRDGVLIEVGGRKVIKNDQGENIFEDNGELVSEFRKRITTANVARHKAIAENTVWLPPCEPFPNTMARKEG